MKTKLVWALIFCQLTYGNVAPSVGFSSSVLGIAKVGQASPSLNGVYPVMERRVQRWLENRVSASFQTERIGTTIPQHEMDEMKVSLELSRRQKEIRLFLRERHSATKQHRCAEVFLNRIFATYSQNLNTRSSIHSLLIAESQAHFLLKENAAARRYLLKAIELHPQGSYGTESDWERFSGTEMAGAVFESFAKSASPSLRRDCGISIRFLKGGETYSVSSSSLKVYVDGFLMRGDHFSLRSGRMFRIWAEEGASRTEHSILHCTRPSQNEVILKENLFSSQIKVSAAGIPSLELYRRFRSYILIGGGKDGFRLFLYTPYEALDEIPLERPLSVAYLLETPTDAPLPVATDALAPLLARHHLHGEGTSSYRVGGVVNTENSEVETAWYKKSGFWAIAGTILGGGVILYLATRGEGRVTSQSEIKGKVN